jgi:hypothetical protein
LDNTAGNFPSDPSGSRKRIRAPAGSVKSVRVSQTIRRLVCLANILSIHPPSLLRDPAPDLDLRIRDRKLINHLAKAAGTIMSSLGRRIGITPESQVFGLTFY